MFDFVYQLLAGLGYTHPIHPTMVHVPIGLAVAALIFGILAAIFHKEVLWSSARHCVVLAFIFVFPTVLLGIMDWQHFYAGAWLPEIKVKIILAVILALLLLVALLVARRQKLAVKSLLLLYLLCFCSVVALGYFGGELVFGGWKPIAAGEYKVGKQEFAKFCMGCHPRGGNILAPHLPLKCAPQLASEDKFLAFIRHPHMPDGSKGKMPSFSPKVLTDQQVKELHDYVTKVLVSSSGK